MVGFIRTRRWEIQLSGTTFKITHSCKREISRQSKAKIFQGGKITITTEGHQHLGSIIGSKTFKESDIKELASKRCQEPTKLLEIAKTEPQTAYAAFTSG